MTDMSRVFPEGHRIRLRVRFADPAGEASGAETVDVLQSPDHPSRVTLPVVPG